ncbi:hypothetical protein PF005_g8873 [Phytophthora fragariae]|uniref:Uncharacterized protein n=1 Tax=Phytophthora fragariae TaxID=53985 RepID=A0A6A3SWL9_9STRA|nr:hypothetical protein PF003_g15040 [Phytophthora fragariae]KAE8943018.1 hypothetical protein PF009_g7246 [Phytophthora fragariae]KAE9014194.1 hypothetical protein PF011_g8177 [Phytophthora fragariae]KAE9122168.1 hypothetical protein PF010_g6832 [Phytophthora fragariae]KAE9125577.1 hypothetical protein PF007_g6303 [Phytophthora fragariae]
MDLKVRCWSLKKSASRAVLLAHLVVVGPCFGLCCAAGSFDTGLFFGCDPPRMYLARWLRQVYTCS